MADFEITQEFQSRITNAIQQILNQTFVSGGKTKIKDMRGRLSLACPYCHDSHNDEHKKRGNLFWDSLQYHCFNDGCKKHKTVNQMLREFGLADTLTGNERMAIYDFVKSHASKFETVSTLEYDLFEHLVEMAVPLEDFYKFTNSRPIKKNGQGWDILKSRLLTNKAHEFAIGYNRLYILNLTGDGKKVIGYQIRLLKTTSDNRYLSFNLEKLRAQCQMISPAEALNISNLEADRLNKLSTIFHILQIDFTKTITAFEGPIDAKFMKNSLGLATVNRELDMFDDIPTVRFFFDNDNAGTTAMRSLLKQKRYVFMWNKFISDFNLFEYDNNDELKDLNDIIRVCFNNKLNAYKYINEYFTNASLDSIYI